MAGLIQLICDFSRILTESEGNRLIGGVGQLLLQIFNLNRDYILNHENYACYFYHFYIKSIYQVYA